MATMRITEEASIIVMPHSPKTEGRKKLLGMDVLTSHLRLRGRRRWDWQLGD
jgi:hypothetical protein